MLLLLAFLEANSQVQAYKKRYHSIINSIGYGQEVYQGISNSFIVGNKTIEPAFFLDYVLRQVIKDTAEFDFISNRNSLKMIKPVFVSDDEMVFSLGSGQNKVSFNITKKRLDENIVKSEVRYDTIDNMIIPISYRNTEPFGLSHNDTGVTHISECTLQFGGKSWQINESQVGNLFFPNFLYRSKAIRPVEVFLSEDRKFVYVYIFGLKRYPVMGMPYYNAYMAKLIFSLKKGFLKQFVVTGNIMEEYRCNYEGFVGF